MNLEEDEVEDEVLKKTEMHNDEESAVTRSQIGRGLPCNEDEMSFAKPTMMEKKTHEDVQCQRNDQGVNLTSLEKAEDEEIEISHQEENLPERGKIDEQEELKEKEEKMLEWQETTEACDQSLNKYEEEECKGTNILFEGVEVESSEEEELPSCVYEKSSSVDDLCMMKMKLDDHQETMESRSFEEAKEKEKAKVAVMMKEGDPPLRGADVMTPYKDGSEKNLEGAISFHYHGEMVDVEKERGKRKEGKEKRKNEREEKGKRKMKKRWPMSHKPILANICLMSAGVMNFILQKRNEDEDTAFEEQMSKWQASHINEEERSPKKKIADDAARIKMKMKKIRRRKKKRRWSTQLYPCSKKKKKKEKKEKKKKLMEELKDEEDMEDDDLQMFAARKKMRGLLGKVKMKS